MSIMTPVTVQFLKNPDRLHWGFEAGLLGEDGHGVWIGVPRGTKRWKGRDSVRPTTEDAVFCAPHEGWWHLHYNGATTQFSHFVDIVTPPMWVSRRRYEMVDLDLDVVRRQDGTVEIEDEDEFEIHQIEYGYTTEMIRRAEQQTELVVSWLSYGQEPFFETADSWLAKL
jgi:protein associated with RNAse G/E